MTDAGWHPDPHGRADRRYHDGTRWTEHVADAEGATSVDPPDPDPSAPRPAAPVIGPPPPRATPAPSAPEAAPAAGPQTERLSPELLAAATSPSPATPPPAEPPAAPADHTVVMTPEDVAAAAALAPSTPPPVGAAGTRHTEEMSADDVAAAAALAAAGPDNDAPAGPAPRRPGTRPSIVGLVLAALGTGLGIAALLALPWGTGPDTGYRDVRELVDTVGPDLGTAVNAFVLTGALWVVVVGGPAALARALGAAWLRIVAAVVVVLGTAGLAVLGFAAVDVALPSLLTSADDLAPDAGAPVTLPDGSPVTDPTSGAPVTVPEGGLDPGTISEDAVAEASIALGEDRLSDAAVLGAVVLVGAGVLTLAGLLLRGAAGHVLTALGLLVGAGWAVATVVLLGDRAELGDVGSGLYAVAGAAVLLAVAAAVPGRRRPTPAT